MINSEGRTIKDENKNYRRERIKFQLHNARKSWNVFYRSRYGKTGFYLVMFFVIVTLISPLIIMHNNPTTYIVPEEDFSAAGPLITHHLPFSINASSPPTGTASSPTGSSLIYVDDSSHIYGISLTSNSTYIFLNSSNLMTLDSFTVGDYSNFINYGSLSLRTYLLTANSTDLILGNVSWSGTSYGKGKPSVSFSTLHMSNVVLPPISSALTYHTSESGLPEFDDKSFSPAFILAVNQSSNSSNKSYYLNSYYLSGFGASNSSHIFTVKLPYNVLPSALKFYGSLFSTTSSQMTLVVQGSHILGYNDTGSLVMNVSMLGSVSQIYIPNSYQYSVNSYNSVFSVTGNYVYGTYLNNGTNYKVFTSGSKIAAISTSSGGSGFPSLFVVVNSDNNVSVLSAPNFLSFSIKLTFPVTGIVEYSSNFLFYNNLKGDYVYLEPATTHNILWSISLNVPSTAPTIFLNPSTARESIALISGNTFHTYSTSPKDLNPLPPTFHTISGQILPLGTTIKGKDVWSQFIGSFSTDMFIGVFVGIGILLISLLIGMVIGYYSGFISSGVETFALAIFLIPGLPLLIVVASIVGPSLLGVIAVLVALSWPFASFTLIGMVRSLKTRTFVDAAKVSGASTFQILRKHMIPNVTPILIYLTAINIGGAVAAVSTLQILGIAPLSVPTWGGMLSGYYSDFFALALAPWWFVPPIAALTLFIFAFIFIARGMDEVVNPRLGGRR
ncbi:ABC transporter permease [Oxyplasma meridianum]|uniref:ABC transporter permease n=1 Tax=Oxyplasma meridianum TaxID=3073602 RepID=A0AAX4NHP4_9ARCH